MAHADYQCCACCDRKMAYDSDAPPKSELCGECVAKLIRAGADFDGSRDGFLHWIIGADATEVVPALNEAGYCPCFYGNGLDDAVREKYSAIGEQVPTR